MKLALLILALIYGICGLIVLVMVVCLRCFCVKWHAKEDCEQRDNKSNHE